MAITIIIICSLALSYMMIAALMKVASDDYNNPIH